MVEDDLEKVSFDKNVVLQYLNFIGLDESEFNNKIKKNNKFKLVNLSDMYDVSNAKKVLPTSTSKEVGSFYELLVSQLDDELLYDSPEYRNQATNDAFYILNQVSSIDVSDQFDSFTIFERTNSLLSSIISGIVCSDNIEQLRMMYDNAGSKFLYDKALKGDDLKPLKRLYLLMTLSKFEDSEIDYQIFDNNEKIDDKKLIDIVATLMNSSKQCKAVVDKPIKKGLLFKRPTYKELREIESYK